MRKSFWTILALLLSLAIGGNVWSQAVVFPEFIDLDASIMRPDREIRLRWIEEYERAPFAINDEEIELRLSNAQAQMVGTSINLLNYLQYTPSERSQGSCGNCWVWANNGIMEIALNVQNGIKDRFSIQFLDSCETDDYACCGGYPSMFASWYDGQGLAIPWSNTNASYQDSSRRCSNQFSALSCGSIGTAPNYPITSIQAQVIQTVGVGQSTAIANIKNILNQNRGIYFGFDLADQTDWNAFQNFWVSQGESTLWNPDGYCGQTWVDGQGGGHGVLIVGYNDEDSNPANHYWIVLNSWGTAGGNRPNGLFFVPMYMNYDCKIHESGSDWPSREFWTLSVAFNPQESETISIPSNPSGPTSGNVWTSYIYSTGGSSSNLGHPIECRFYWGDGTYSNWSSSTSVSKSWSSPGTYSVQAQARCATHRSVESNWSGVLSVTISTETISSPSLPSGPTSGVIGLSYNYSTGGSISNLSHPIEYRFDLGDGTYSNWSSATSVSKSWSSPGTYPVKAQARCVTHPSVESNWSGALSVIISPETVSPPSIPSGTTNGVIGIGYNYSTGGSVSNLGHPVEYRFDWGDGSYSNWSSLRSAIKSWSSPGTYTIKTQARCANDPTVVSGWSSGLTVNIMAPITLQSPSSEAIFEACSLYSLPTFSWTIGEVFKGYEIQFSSDKNFGSPPAVKVKVPGAATQKTMTSTTWKRIMLIPGESGGKVYWKFVGTRANKTTFTSEVRSIAIEPPQAVGSPNISNTQKNLFPTLSWDHHCNTKFIVWFGSDSSFTKKVAFTFNIKNPNENNGVFEKVLTRGQWTAIRNLVEDVSNSSIYWYVESFDKLKRNAETEVMSFILMD